MMFPFCLVVVSECVSWSAFVWCVECRFYVCASWAEGKSSVACHVDLVLVALYRLANDWLVRVG